MPIHGLQNRYRELGRLKFGEDLGDRPTQLDTWRIVSPDPKLIQAAAALWGGTPTDTYSEVVTEANALPVLLPAQDIAATQWYEHWTRGGLQRRCTGTATVEFSLDGQAWYEIGPCECDPEKRECRLRTHLRVLLPDLPDIGVWRLTTSSRYAATELPATVAAIRALHGGDLTPAELALEARTTKRPGQPPHNYIVPVLRTNETLTALMAARENVPVPDALPAPEAVPDEPAAGTVWPTGENPSSPDPEISGGSQNAPPSPEPAQIEPETAAATTTGPERSGGTWATLGRLLDRHGPDNLPDTPETLIAVLDELDDLMVNAGLWAEGGLEQSAQKRVTEVTDPANWGSWRDWTPARLRTFATRALLDAHDRYHKDRRRPTP